MKYYKIIISILVVLLLVFLYVFNVFFKNNSKNINPGSNLETERPIVDEAEGSYKGDLASNDVKAQKSDFSIKGNFQSVIEVPGEEVNGVFYSYRINILRAGENMFRLWLTEDEYKSLLNQVVMNNIYGGSNVLLELKNGIFTISKTKI